MDLTQDKADAKYLITGYTADCVMVNNEPHYKSLIIAPNTLISSWEVNDISQLNEKNLAQITRQQPEIVLIGTGQQLQLPDPKMIAYFAHHQIGLEAMNTQAACRTFGILAAEARKVMAGIIISND
ncbi:MAG: Mth938-like domain-containing protein [Pseudomonadota bacterium]